MYPLDALLVLCIREDTELGGGLFLQPSLCNCFGCWNPAAPMLDLLCGTILEACGRHPLPQRSGGGVALSVDRETFREVIVDVPLIQPALRVKPHAQQHAAGAQYPPRFRQERGFVGEMMDGIDTKQSVKGMVSQRQAVCISTDQCRALRTPLRLREHPC